MSHICNICNDTGKIVVSYADPENGPADDPADEIGWEYCDCPTGDALWRKEARENNEAERTFFTSHEISSK